VNKDLVLSTTDSGTAIVGGTTKRYSVSLRLAPHFAN